MRAARLTGERKPVTALFADVVGSTALAEQMDPEDWTAMINEAFDLMSRAVFRYEGTIAQLQGDAMLAFFGAPVAHEDDPDRAIFAALDMLEATDEFASQLRSTHGIDFRIRAGINSGPVMVGNIGSDLRYEYTALGDAVNVAARMQTAAEPGTVLITEMTRRLTGDTFEVDDLGGDRRQGQERAGPRLPGGRQEGGAGTKARAGGGRPRQPDGRARGAAPPARGARATSPSRAEGGSPSSSASRASGRAGCCRSCDALPAAPRGSKAAASRTARTCPTTC